jgi:hypothetical protein
LFDDPSEGLPAHQLVEGGDDHLLLDHRVGDHYGGADDEDQHEKRRKLAPVILQKLRRRRCLQKVYQPAERPVERGVDRARKPAYDEQEDERALGLACEEADEGPGIARQHFALGVGEGLDNALRLAPGALCKTVIPALFIAHLRSSPIRQPRRFRFLRFRLR